MTIAAWLVLVAMTLLDSGCTPAGSGAGSSSGSGTLALSPGMQISSLVSGGIAGVSDIIQVSDDWNLIVVRRRGDSFVRRLDGDEQASLREVLGRFASLSFGQSDGDDVADGMSTTLHARGSGSGNGTATDAKDLYEILNKAAAIESGG